MRKFLMGLIAALIAIALTSALAPAIANAAPVMTLKANASDASQDLAAQKATGHKPKGNVKYRCIKSPKPVDTIDGLTVLNSKACFNGAVYKEKKCHVYAEKWEQPAPPRDPQALCKGKIVVKMVGVLRTQKCPPGYFGAMARLSVRLAQVMKAKGFAKTVSRGRAWALAQMRLLDKARISGSIQQSCMEVPDETEEHTNPVGELFFGEHATDLGGTMPVFGRVRASDGAVATLGTPVVTPKDLGAVYNWRTVSTESDGKTPCATGWVCYQGYFRVERAGTPGTEVRGTMVALAEDNMDGESWTQPKEFKVAYIAHPVTRQGSNKQ